MSDQVVKMQLFGGPDDGQHFECLRQNFSSVILTPAPASFTSFLIAGEHRNCRYVWHGKLARDGSFPFLYSGQE